MGNVIAIGLTPSRTGIVIGPSRTGIVIGPSRTGIVIGPSRTGIVIGPSRTGIVIGPSRTGIVIGPSRTGIVIGPSRTGIVIGPSRTGIVIGRLLNAQLRHMSVRAAWRHKLSLFWPQTRCRQDALYSLVVQSSLEFSLSLSFAFKYLINARAHFAFTFISGLTTTHFLQ